MMRPILIASFLACLLLASGSAYAAIITVCASSCTSTTVQGGINAASNGDIVMITDSRQYNENVVVDKQINLTSGTLAKPTIFYGGDDFTTINMASDGSSVSRLIVVHSGPSNTLGVITVNVNNVTIFNNTVSNVDGDSDGYGIQLLNSYYSTVRNNIVNTSGNSPTNWGIYLTDSYYNNVVSNTISTNGTVSNYGIHLYASSYNNVTSNTISTNGTYDNYGISIESSSSDTVSGNIISTHGTGSANTGIYLSGSSSETVSGNTVSTSGTDTNYGIFLSSSSSNTVSSNNISTNGVQNNYGVYLGSSNDNSLNSNNITTNGTDGNNYGIYMDSVSSNTVASNFISTNGNINGFGIYSISSSGDIIDSNNISTHGTAGSSGNHGVLIGSGSSSETVSSNTIHTDGTYQNFGIYVTGSDNIILTFNNITTNGTDSNWGIHLESGSSDTISGNTVFARGTGVSNYGIYSNGASYETISDNIISTNGTNTNHGIYLTSSSSFSITSNNISTHGTDSNYGILLESSSSDIALGNIISTHGTGSANTGIYLSGSSSETVSGNTIYTDGTHVNHGIYLTSSDSNTLTSNNISTYGTYNNYGIILEASSSDTVSGNNISTNGTGGGNPGFYISSGSSSETISGNTIYTHGGTEGNYGILLESASSITFTGDRITTTSFETDYGIYTAGDSDGNTFTDVTIDATQAPDVRDDNTGGVSNYLRSSTFNESDISFSSDSIGKVFVQRRVEVQTIRKNGNALSGVTVSASDSASVDDSENPTSTYSGTTNSSGYVSTYLTEFMANLTYNYSTGYLYFNDYAIVASKVGYQSNSTTLTINSDEFLQLVLKSNTLTTLFGKGTDSYELSIDSDVDSVYATVNSENASHYLPSGWSHVAMTFDSGTIKLYVNGQFVGTATTSATPDVNSNSVMVGVDAPVNMDEFRFYSRALSPSEVGQHYSIGSALKAIVSAAGGGSFGRNFNISTSTSDGSFSNRHITDADLLAGTTQSVNLPNVTGTPTTVVVTSNSCNQVLTATKKHLDGVYC